MTNKDFDFRSIEAYLRSHGIPTNFAKRIVYAMANKAIENKDDAKYDRILTAMAYAIHVVFNPDNPNDIIKCLQEFDDIATRMNAGEDQWGSLMKRLRDETGIITRSGGNDRIIFEYIDKEDFGDAE